MEKKRGFPSRLEAAKAVVATVDTVAVTQLMSDDAPKLMILDVRQTEEYSEGAIPGAVHIPRGVLEEAVEQMVPDRDSRVVIYCASGVRSVFAAETLGNMGYSDVASMNGGFNKWKDENRVWDRPVMPDPAAGQSYTQQFLSPEDLPG